jgi:hypothetical protein
MSQFDFEDIRPYNDNEVQSVALRVSESVYFHDIVKRFFPEENIRTFTEKFRQLSTIKEFQVRIMHRVIWSIISQTIYNLTCSGFDAINPDKKGIFISNHRDILLDSALLQFLLYKNGIDTSEITFGSNLMISPFIIDVGKLNKMFKIVRGGTVREVLINSRTVSEYMRYAITEKKQSIWIAQRNGRTKDGDDKTEVAVLKMFAMSSKLPFVENFMEINLIPIAVSYEYEPCDFMKVREVYISRYKKYEKEEGEDLASIVHGINQKKGNVSMVACKPLTIEELEECDKFHQNDKFKKLAELIDQRIYNNYKLWKTNYIAFDLLKNSDKFSNHYTEKDKETFINYMNTGLADIDGDMNELTSIFLNIYANPVNNCLQTEKTT